MNKEEQKAELDEASDFNQLTFKTYPTIKFTASKNSEYSEVGSFTLLENDEDGNLKATDLGKEIKCIFLKRGKFRLKAADFNTRDITFSKTKEITLYGKTAEGKQTVAAVGTYHDLKKQYGLSTYQYPYVALEDGTIARLCILPSSLANYWEYCDDFKNSERIYEFYTTVKAAPELTKGKKGSYYLMDFLRSKELDEDTFSEIAATIKELRDELKKKDEAYEEEQSEYDRMNNQQELVPDDDIPIVGEEAPPMEDEEAENLSKESL